MNKQPILSICIPIYNRLSYLDKMLARFLEDKDLFHEKIELFVSDNCSQDDLAACCEKYRQQGLKMDYHRNDENLGPDRNFELCFYHAKGQYTWLLGSDDIPVCGFVRKMLCCLDNHDYGLFHLSMKKLPKVLTAYNDNNEMAVAVRYYITFMSANIIRTDSLHDIEINHYRNTNLIQVPVFLNACLTAKENAIYADGYPFEKGSDGRNNGGYHLFRVFISNLFGIYEVFVKKGLLSAESFCKIKEIEFKEFLVNWILNLLVFKSNHNFETIGSWRILWKYYGRSPYAYWGLFKGMMSSVVVYLKLRINRWV